MESGDAKKIAAGIAVILLLYSGLTYYGMAGQKIKLDQTTANLDAEYQRRADVINSMVKTTQASLDVQLKMVKGYAEAREGMTAASRDYKAALARGDVNATDAAAAQALQYNSDIMIMARSEAVPETDLSSITQLNNEIAGLGNTIAKERKTYNEVVASYNWKVTVPPSSIIAGIFGFEKAEYYHAEPGAEKMPDTSINLSN
jgi:LemA protein